MYKSMEYELDFARYYEPKPSVEGATAQETTNGKFTKHFIFV